MIKPTVVSRATDWFAIDRQTAYPKLYQNEHQLVPGARFDPSRQDINYILAHRSHLPLLSDSSEAVKILINLKKYDWITRDKITETLGFKLRNTQQSALDFIESRRGVLLSDDLRLGKTATCVMSHDPMRGQLVVVAPLSTRGVWLGWLKRVFPDTPIGICTGKKIDKEKLNKPIVFLHYDILPGWQSVMPIGTLVFDEAHALVNRTTRRSNAAIILASRAEKVIAATGTPIWSMPKNLWNIIGMLAPGAWGDYWTFGNRYGAPIQTAYGTEFTGTSNKEELNARMSEIMIRRLWKDTRNDLPPISRNIVVADVDDATRRRLDILAAKMKNERTNTIGNLAHYRSQLSNVKLKTVVEEANKIKSRGEPVVIWTWHKELAGAIAQALEGSHVIHGEIHVDKREKILNSWRSAPSDALIATMAVAQVGIDLSHAHLAIFAELDYVPAMIGQAEMRTYSPDFPMNITFVVANHIVDQRIVRSLVNKLGAADQLGLGAAVDAIDALRDAIDGPREDGDMERFLDDILNNEGKII